MESINRAANEIAEFAPDEEFDDLVATGNLIFAGKPDGRVAILDEGDLHTAFASDVVSYETSTLKGGGS